MTDITLPLSLSALKQAIAAIAPPGWRYRVNIKTNGYAVVTIVSAPSDLVAVNRVAYEGSAPKGYVKICPSAYECPWCHDSSVIGAMWKVLCKAPRRELWIGTPTKPFAVISK